jgi:hypothetical protein
MTLTFSHIVNRLDDLNNREKQVRKFYRPLSAKERTKPVSASRHRFADVLEPGDVVRTIGKTEGWEDENSEKNSIKSGSAPCSAVVSRPSSTDHGDDKRISSSSNLSSSRLAQRSFSAEASRNPSRNVSRRDSASDHVRRPSSASLLETSQYQPIAPRIAGEVGRIESQLHKVIQEKFYERKESLRRQLYREVGLNEDGTVPDPEAAARPPDQGSIVDPLFKPAGKTLTVAKKKPDSEF